MAVMGNTPDMQTVKSPLLATPPEILVLIAESVADVSTSPYKTTVYQASDKATLVNFSLANKAIRRACISAGLFNACILPAGKVASSLDLKEVFSTWPMRLGSLGIDLGNPELWDSCADIMGSFPQLDELVLSGCYPTRLSTRKFLNSELGTKFRSFKGTSVALRRASLTCTQSQILFIIGGSNVTAFKCLECDLSWSGWGTEGTWTALYPKLESFMFTLPSFRRKSFLGADVLINCILAPMGI